MANQFKCECGAVFASADELRKHQETHQQQTGEIGQTEEERREWKETRQADRKEAAKSGH